MLKKFLSLPILLLISHLAFAQKVIVHGRVETFKGKDPLPGVTVLLDKNEGTQTDAEGRYSITTTPGKHQIEFRLLSFETVLRNVLLPDTGAAEVNVTMQEKASELRLVVVSAGKFEQNIEDVTVSMEVLKPDLITNNNITSMDDALDKIPGVSIVDGQANIRGGSGWSYGAGSRVQILVDDLPELTADAGDVKWSFLPVENLEQVEVIKGASSVLFGSSALNGVMNIRTAYPREEPQTKINFFTAAYDKAKIDLNDTTYRLDWWGSIPQQYHGLNFFHSQKFGQFDLVAGGYMFADESYRKGENEQRLRLNANTRYRFKNIEGLSAGANFNHMQTDGTLFFLWKNDTTGAFLPATNTLSDYTTYRTTIDPFVTYVNNHGGSHKIRTRWFNTTNENNTSQNSTADVYYGEYQYQQHFKNNLTLTGGLVEQATKVRSELYGDHNGNQLGVYVQGDYKWKRLTLSAGGRAEQYRIDGKSDSWQPVFRGGLNVHALKETYVRASVGQGYRYPSIAEKFVLTNVGSVYIYPNPDLEAEKGISMEIGVRQGFRAGHLAGYLDLAAFRNQYYHMIEFGFAQWGALTDPLFGLGFRSFNVGDTRIEGLDLSLMARYQAGDNFTLTLQGGFTYIDPRQLTYDSAYTAKVGAGAVMGSDSTDFLKYRNRYSAKADLDLGYHRFALGFGMRYTSRMENIDQIFVSGIFDVAFPPGLGIEHYRTYHKKGDTIIDGHLSWNFLPHLKFSFIVKNMFNTIYMQRPGDMQPPRTFVIQLGFEN